MTHEEIIAMAKEAGGYDSPQYPENLVMDEHDLGRFAALVAAKERERLFGKAQRDGEMRLMLHRWEGGQCFAAAAHFSAEQTHCGPDDLLQMAVGRLDDSLDAGIAAADMATAAAPKAAPAQQEWRLVLPGGKYTDKGESARIGDYNRGWNDYRKTAIAALNSVVWPARTSGSWVGASTWLRNNYQNYPNIASLCDAMLEAAPQQEPVSPISVGWGRDYQDNGKPIDASAAPVPNLALAPQQEAQEPVAWESTILGYIKYITQAQYEKFRPNVRRWYKPYKCSSCAAPQPAPAPLSDDVVKDAARYRWLRDVPMAEWPDELATAFQLQQNAIWDAAIDAALAAQGEKDAG